jgi:two-component system, chemotaxis family, protein-glutamate methylesterase/glutaminase
MPGRDIIVIGTSTGGITALQTIVAALPDGFPASIFAVLHTSEDNTGLLPPLLNKVSRVPAFYGVHDTPILPGRIYLAPPGRHLIVERGRVRLSVGPRENRHRPAADVLFRSAALAYGPRVIGVVATGHLDDGAAGLAAIKARGGIAIVQDPNQAMAPSMPRSALEATDVDYVLPLEAIGPKLVDLVGATEFEPRKGPEEVIVGINRTEARFSCPECGGALNEVEEGDMVRLRCRVGHAYSPESLFEDQSEALERALWAAIRTLEEHAEFSARLADKSAKRNHRSLVDRFEERAKTSREHASILRELLEHSTTPVVPHGEEATGIQRA